MTRACGRARARVVYVAAKVPAPGCISGGCTVSTFASCPHTRASCSRAGRRHAKTKHVEHASARHLCIETLTWCSLRQAFEQEIFKASLRAPAEGEANIFMCRGLVVLYRSQDETTFYVVGSDDENEVILVSFFSPAHCTTREAALNQSCWHISMRQHVHVTTANS